MIPLYKSHNGWPYQGSQDTSYTHSRVGNKPMTNQKARAIVQQDYYLNGKSHNGSHTTLPTGTATSSNPMGYQPVNPVYGYETFAMKERVI